MNWFDNTKPFMDAWTTAQQEMLKTWLSMADTTPNSQAEFAKMWQNLAQQTMQGWMTTATPTAQDVGAKMVENQQALINMMQLAMQTWQGLVPTFQSGGDWQATLNEQMASLRSELLNNVNAGMRASGNMGELWQSYTDQWQSFLAPWQNALFQGTQFNASAASGDRDAVLQLTQLYWDAYQDTFGKLLQAPGLGYTRELDEKLRKGFAAWTELQEAMFEYNVIMADTWVQAFGELMQEIVGQAEKGTTLSLRDFLNKWSGTADRIFKTAFASPEYVTVQSNLVNMMMRYRVRQREVLEVVFQALDLPTRNEVDEAHRRIHDLRREMKALRRELDALKGDEAKPKAAPRTTTRRKTTTTEE